MKSKTIWICYACSQESKEISNKNKIRDAKYSKCNICKKQKVVQKHNESELLKGEK
jgi:hypothetical protein